MKQIRVAIFEDNHQLRDGLYNLLEASEGFICVGAFANCINVLDNIEETRPDVVLMDIEMPEVNGIEAVKKVKDKFLEVKILMETIFEDDDKIFRSICNGAQGYILKNTPPEEILNSIKEICEGGAPMSPVIASKVLTLFRYNLSNENNDSFNLSVREKEILKCLVDGMSYKLIADACYISADTVNGHIKNIYKKLQVHSKGEAVAKAIRGKIV
jgi:DNA-binding NarL/FixJ family response regulator